MMEQTEITTMAGDLRNHLLNLTGIDPFDKRRDYPRPYLRYMIGHKLKEAGASWVAAARAVGLSHSTLLCSKERLDYAISHPGQFLSIKGWSIKDLWESLDKEEKRQVEERQKGMIDIEANALYMLSTAMEIIREDLEQRMKGRGTMLKFEKKHAFKEMEKAGESIGRNYDIIIQDIWRDAKNGKNYDDWHEEANIVAKIFLLYIDRFSPSPRSQSELMAYMRSNRSLLGAITDRDLDRFNMG